MLLDQAFDRLQNETDTLSYKLVEHLVAVDASRRAELVFLLAELDSLWNVFDRIRDSILFLADSSSEPPVDGRYLQVIHRYRFWMASISTSLSDISPVVAAAEVAGYRSKFFLAIDTSASIREFAQHLTVLDRKPFGDEISAVRKATFQAVSPFVKASRPIPHVSALTENDIASWLGMFTSAEFNREPDSFYQEQLILRSLRLRIPHYSIAASVWPLCAEKYWASLQSPIRSLFRTPSSFNFVQWVLEYGREAESGTLGSHAGSPDAILYLTDALCDGSASPLHIAAAIGLPSLCSALLTESGLASSQQTTSFGSPLFCALLGPQALSTQSVNSHLFLIMFSSLSDLHTEARVATISRLLDAGADCKYQHEWSNFGKTSLAGLALRATRDTKNESIFKRIVAGGAACDDSFLEVLGNMSAFPRSDSLTCRLMTLTLDCALLQICLEDETWYSALERVQRWMSSNGKTVSFGDDGPRLADVPDDWFFDFLQGAVAEGETFTVERLSHDPRFDPNWRGNGILLLHTAVQNDQPGMVDFLLKQGATLTATDIEGRPTLMLVENSEMLSKLVQEHGASTTAVDGNGRNIWHFMAASNDLDCLVWLCENDPYKRENLTARATNGNTPLADAFHYFDDLLLEGRTPLSAQPSAARLLLKECTEPECLWSRTPLPHLAAAWGHLDLVESLLALGADFRALDDSGSSPLHCLNIAASPELVERLQNLCHGLPIGDDRGYTPVETTIWNTWHIFDNLTDPVPFRAFKASEAVFELMLTDEVLTYRDNRDRGCWARFANRICRGSILKWGDRAARSGFSSYLMNALKCLAARDVLREYEIETQQSPVCVFTEWDFPRDHFIWILENSDRTFAHEFFQSRKAQDLLMHDLDHSNSDKMIRYLLSKGMSPHEPYNNRSPLEAAIQSPRLSFTKVTALLVNVTPSRLAERQQAIFKAIAGSRDPEQLDTLRLLLHVGLSPNPGPSMSVAPSLLAATHDQHEMVKVLLGFGANPDLGQSRINPVFTAVKKGNHKALKYMAHQTRDGDDRSCFWDPERGDGERHPLQEAAYKGDSASLEILLTHSPLRKHIRKDAALIAVLVAAERTDLKLLKRLHGHGLDMGAVDDRNATALHRVCTIGDEGCVRFLLQVGPKDVMDADGDTPWDIAQRGGDEAIIRLFRSYGFGHGDNETGEAGMQGVEEN